jgi:hypothetical protein
VPVQCLIAKRFFRAALFLGCSILIEHAFANEAHQRMTAMSASERNSFLTRYLQSSGERCDSVTKAFFQGSSKQGQAFWNAACRNGKAYLIMINNDATGSSRIMDCSLLKAVNAGECFKPFK